MVRIFRFTALCCAPILVLLLSACVFLEGPDRTNPMDPSYSDLTCIAESSGSDFVISWPSAMAGAHLITSVVPQDIRNAVNNYASYSNRVHTILVITTAGSGSKTWAKINSANPLAPNYFAIINDPVLAPQGSTIASVH